MEAYQRKLFNTLNKKGRLSIISTPRQSGKSTLMRDTMSHTANLIEERNKLILKYESLGWHVVMLAGAEWDRSYEWCEENCVGSHDHYGIAYAFELKQDAMMFKLAH